MLGDNRPFELEWASVYQFACRRIDNFRYGRVLFAGDAAHQVSPFGARGANSGVQDIDNLTWKLKLVLDGDALPGLIDTYHEAAFRARLGGAPGWLEDPAGPGHLVSRPPICRHTLTRTRAIAADDNLLASTRSTDFISPKSKASRRYRDAVLELAEDNPFARPLVNSGRLSRPTPYVRSSLNTPDEHSFSGRMQPGTNCDDAPITRDGAEGWLLNALGEGFTVLTFGAAPVRKVASGRVRAAVLAVLIDRKGALAERYDGRPGVTYLIRPDQHVAARWRSFDAAKIERALARAVRA